jgi:hypothetical protein
VYSRKLSAFNSVVTIQPSTVPSRLRSRTR